MATPLEIIRGISQAAANAYDGALDEDGNRIEIGLRREEGHLVHDSRLMDGFKVKFHGNVLIVTYQSDIKLREVHSGRFEDEILQTINNAANFLKKEYKRLTGETLTLTKTGNHDVFVEDISRIRCNVVATCDYKIGGMTNVVESDEPESKDTVDDAIKNWLGSNANKRSVGTGMLGNAKHEGASQPKNVKGERDLEPR